MNNVISKNETAELLRSMLEELENLEESLSKIIDSISGMSTDNTIS